MRSASRWPWRAAPRPSASARRGPGLRGRGCDTVGPWGAWASAIGGLGNVAGSGSSSTFTYNVGGAAGIDYLDPLPGGPGRRLPRPRNGSTASWARLVRQRSVTAYGSFTQAAFYTALSRAMPGRATRVAPDVIAGLQPRANSSTGANQFLGQVRSGYKIGIYAPAFASLTPFGASGQA